MFELDSSAVTERKGVDSKFGQKVLPALAVHAMAEAGVAHRSAQRLMRNEI